ncbi:MAG: hypothetical protein OHK0045_07470 [Raineya sp.]
MMLFGIKSEKYVKPVIAFCFNNFDAILCRMFPHKYRKNFKKLPERSLFLVLFFGYATNEKKKASYL